MPGFALLFPGQGSQYVGMGADLYAASGAARAVFDEAEQVWGGGLCRLIFEGPADELADTANAQPSLFVASLACWAALREALDGFSVTPAFVAGHSVGEYAALVAAGALSFAAGLRLVRERGLAMKAAGEARPGGMAAVLGLSIEQVTSACKQAQALTGEVVVVANDNAPGQVVISGTQGAVQAACESAKAQGAKRVVPLAVSVASHSPLMEPAASRLIPALRQAGFSRPRWLVIGNWSAKPLSTVDDVLSELAQQLTSRVRWTETIQHMLEHGTSTFIEVGPKEVLTGLTKRIAPGATSVACNNVDSIRQAAQILHEEVLRGDRQG